MNPSQQRFSRASRRPEMPKGLDVHLAYGGASGGHISATQREANSAEFTNLYCHEIIDRGAFLGDLRPK